MNWKPPAYLSTVPDALWFWDQVGDGHERVHAHWIRQALRVQLCERQNHRCCYCGVAVTCEGDIAADDFATLEHVQRRSDGGTDQPENLVIACHRCNTARGDAPADVYTHSAVRMFQTSLTR